MVVVDSSIWIQAFRASASPERRELDRLLEQREVVMVGPVLAEVLQGARNPREFEQIRLRLNALPYVQDTRDTWARAGAISYELRRGGQAVALTDLVIAALAVEYGHQVYTLDDDFQRIPGVELYPTP